MNPRKPYPASSWCFLRTSEKLRAAINFRIDALQHANPELRLQDIASAAGVVNYRMSSYINGMSKPLTQFELLKLCKYLGIRVELKVTFDETVYGKEPENDLFIQSHPT